MGSLLLTAPEPSCIPQELFVVLHGILIILYQQLPSLASPGDHLGLLLLLLLLGEDGAWAFGTEVVWRFAGQ